MSARTVLGVKESIPGETVETARISEAVDALIRVLGLMYPGVSAERLTVDGEDPFIHVSGPWGLSITMDDTPEGDAKATVMARGVAASYRKMAYRAFEIIGG